MLRKLHLAKWQVTLHFIKYVHGIYETKFPSQDKESGFPSFELTDEIEVGIEHQRHGYWKANYVEAEDHHDTACKLPTTSTHYTSENADVTVH